MPACASAHPATDAFLYGGNFLEVLHAHPDGSVDGSVLDVFHKLHSRFQGSRIPLDQLDASLRHLHNLHGSSMLTFTKVIKRWGICLGTGQVFGSPTLLKDGLRMNFGNWGVSCHKAKAYKYMSQCLASL